MEIKIKCSGSSGCNSEIIFNDKCEADISVTGEYGLICETCWDDFYMNNTTWL